MEKIIMQRGFGKTHQLIKMSSYTRATIVCHSREEAGRIVKTAEDGCLNIPEPMTYSEFMRGGYYVAGISGVLIDNVEMFLNSLSTIPIKAITLTP